MRNRQSKCNPDTPCTGQVPGNYKLPGTFTRSGLPPDTPDLRCGTGSCAGRADSTHNPARYSIVHYVPIM